MIDFRKRKKIGVRAKINVRFLSDPPRLLEMPEDNQNMGSLGSIIGKMMVIKKQ